MEIHFVQHSKYGLENHGIQNVRNVFWNIPRPTLIEEAICRREGHLAHYGPLVVRTGHHTGRSAKDKFIFTSFLKSFNKNAPSSKIHFLADFDRTLTREKS